MGGIRFKQKAYSEGFTILETVLFLTISSFLLIAILAGSSAAIEQQRYRDGVDSFVALLQNQYNDVLNTYNIRGNDTVCTIGPSGSVIISSTPDAAIGARGTSDCVLFGKTISVDGPAVTISELIGKIKPGQTILASDTDAQAFQKYAISRNSETVQTQDLEWGQYIGNVTRNGVAPAVQDKFYIVMAHASRGSSVRIFTVAGTSTVPANVETVMTDGAAGNVKTMQACVLSQSSFSGSRSSVIIDPTIGGTTSFQRSTGGSC